MQDGLTVRLTLFSSSATCAMLASIIPRILVSSALAIEISAELLAVSGRKLFSVAIEVILMSDCTILAQRRGFL